MKTELRVPPVKDEERHAKIRLSFVGIESERLHSLPLLGHISSIDTCPVTIHL